MSEKTTSIESGILVTMDEERGVIEKGHLLIADDKIVRITKSEDELRKFNAENKIRALGKLILPGFINTHMHTRPMRTLGDSWDIMRWHANYPDNFTRLLTSEEARTSALLAFSECLRSGITGVISMAVNVSSDLLAAEQIGIRARICSMAETREEVMANVKIVEENRQTASRVQPWIGFENPDMLDDPTLRTVRQVSDTTGTGVHTHLSEVERNGTERLEDLGFLDSKVVLAHCVKITEEDLARLAKFHVNVAHNPISNMKLGIGVAPVLLMRDKGLNVSLGTDGGLNLVGREDIFEQMRTAIMIQRGFATNPGVMVAHEVLRMATVNGSHALGLRGNGVLKEGAKADIVIIDSQHANFAPLVTSGRHANLESVIVFAATANDVDIVLVDGNTVVRNGTVLFADQNQLRAKVQVIAERILSKIA